MKNRGGHGVDVARRASDGLGNHATFGIKKSGRKVARFANDRAECSPAQRLSLFFDDSD
jgi:hypothetical protein